MSKHQVGYYGGHRQYDPYRAFHSAGFDHQLDLPREITSSIINVRLEQRETPEAYVFRAELPGFSRNEVKIEVDEGRVLCITALKRLERKENTDMYYRVEQSGGGFVRSVKLPENAKVDHVKAHLNNVGLLTITVPKEVYSQRRHPRVIEISDH